MDPAEPSNASRDTAGAEPATVALPPSAAAAGPALPPHRQRKWRWYVRLTVLAIILLPVIAAILTQGPVPAAIIRGYVRTNLGMEFDADWVSLKLDGRLVVSGMTLRVPGVDGEPGRFVAAERVEVDLDMSKIASMAVTPTAVTVMKPHFRFSQSQRDGVLNVAGLRTAPGGDGPRRLPRVDLHGATLEFGEHNGADYRTLMTLAARGFVAPMDFIGPGYRIRLTQEGGDNLAAGGGPTGAGGAEPRIVLDGTLDLESGSGELSLSGIELAKWTPERIPTEYRELWAGLQMRGRISETRFQFTGNRMGVILTLDEVSMRPPIAAGRPDVMGERRPRMDSVSGTLRFTPGGVEADLTGIFEDQPCRLLVRTSGLGIDSAYSATITARDAKLDYQPRILRFLPELVQDNLERLGWPVGSISAGITIRRAGSQGGPAPPPEISGTLTLDAERLEYTLFPYEFRDIRAILTFDERAIRLVSLTGRAQSGARLFAEGAFVPPTEAAVSDIGITIVDVPADQRLWDALERSASPNVHHALFSEEKHRELVAAGLLLTPELHASLSADLALLRSGRPSQSGLGIEEVTRRLGTPVFEFGGEIRAISVRYRDEPGAESRTTIDVDFRRAGLVPQVFPYPIVARDLRVKLDGDAVAISGPTFQGLSGGNASVSGHARFLPQDETTDGSLRFLLSMDVEATDIPLDQFVVFALPDGRLDLRTRAVVGPPAPAGSDQFSVKRIVTALGLEGPVDCTGSLRTDDDGEMHFDIGVTLKGLTAQPARVAAPGGGAPAGQPLFVSNLSGRLQATERQITVHALDGTIMPAELGLAGLAGLADAGAFSLRGQAVMPQGLDPATFDAELAIGDLDVSLALEDLVAALSPQVASQMAVLRAAHHPSGRLDGSATLTTSQPAEGPARIGLRVGVTGARDLGLDVLGGRIHGALTEGSLGIESGGAGAGAFEDALLRFDRCAGRVSMGEEAPALFELDGAVRLPGEGRRLRLERPVASRVTGARINSGLARAIVTMVSSEELARTVLDETGLRGQFDARAGLELRTPGGPPDDWKITGEIWPHWVEATIDGVPLAVRQVTGSVTLDDNVGRVRALRAIADDWTCEINGTWGIGRAGRAEAAGAGAGAQLPWFLDSVFSLDTRALPPDLLSILPRQVRSTIREADLRIAGGLWTSDTALRLDADEQGRIGVDLAGAVDFIGLSLDAGILLEECNGVVRLHARRGHADPATQLDMTVQADTIRAAGVRVTDAVATVSAGRTPGRVNLTSMHGDSHGGRITASAVIDKPDDAAPARYQAQVEVAGVRFADILADINAHSARQAAAATPADAAPALAVLATTAQPAAGDASRGFVDVQVSVAGTAGEASDRRGRGSLRIAGGDVLQVPLIIPLVQLSNLHLPIGERLDYAQALFYIKGNRLVFDELGLLSNSLAIIGEGQVFLPDYELDLRFNSASRLRLPLLTDVYEALRNEVMTTRVRGTLADPSFGLEQLSGTRRLLGLIFGGRSDVPGPVRPEQLGPEPGERPTPPRRP